jgi:transposase
LLKQELRLLYRLKDPAIAPAHLDAWLACASRSRLQRFVKLARTIRRHRAGILAAIPSASQTADSKGSTAASV